MFLAFQMFLTTIDTWNRHASHFLSWKDRKFNGNYPGNENVFFSKEDSYDNIFHKPKQGLIRLATVVFCDRKIFSLCTVGVLHIVFLCTATMLEQVCFVVWRNVFLCDWLQIAHHRKKTRMYLHCAFGKELMSGTPRKFEGGYSKYFEESSFNPFPQILPTPK